MTCIRTGQVTALCEMCAAGHKPDLFTFTALVNACQRANEAELAFEILKCALCFQRYLAMPANRWLTL